MSDRLTDTELTTLQRYQQEVQQLNALTQIKNQALGDLVKVSLAARGLDPVTHGIEPDGTIKPLEEKKEA